MKNKLLGLGILVLAFVFMIGGFSSSRKALAFGPTITSSIYDRTTGDLVLTGMGFDTASTIDVTTLTIKGEGAGASAFTLTAATPNPTPFSATSATVLITGTDKTAVDAVLDTNGTLASDSTVYNLAAAADWQNTDSADTTTPIAVGTSPATVDLGTAGNSFAILADSGISTTGTTAITGDIGTGPAVTSTAITGFGPVMDSSNQFSTSSLVTGKIFAYNYAISTPSKMNTASLDMGAAYIDAAGRTADVDDLGAGDIGGLTLAPGIYDWSTGVTIPTDVTLAGGSNSIWIFQIAGTLDLSNGMRVNLTGGALPQNIYWQVADSTTLGTTSVFNGNILDLTNIAIANGATLNGRALAQTAVTLIGDTIVTPANIPSASNTTLSDLVITPSTGTITPLSQPITGPYTSNVSHGVSSVTVTPTVSEAHALVTVNTVSVTSGAASSPIPLNVGANTITVVVTAQDLSTQTYTVNIIRAATSSSGSGSYISHPALTPTVVIPTPANTTVNSNTTTTAPSTSCVFIKTLRYGSRSNAVKCLQTILNIDPTTQVATVGAGSPGHESTYFGLATKAAVKKFQKKNGMRADGVVGPKTIKYLKLVQNS